MTYRPVILLVLIAAMTHRDGGATEVDADPERNSPTWRFSEGGASGQKVRVVPDSSAQGMKIRWEYGRERPVRLTTPVDTPRRGGAGAVSIRLRTPRLTSAVRIRLIGEGKAWQHVAALQRGWTQLAIPWSAFVEDQQERDSIISERYWRIVIEPFEENGASWFEIADLDVELPQDLHAKREDAPRIMLNQVGWRPSANKMFLAGGMVGDSFEVLDGSRRVAFRGALHRLDARVLAGEILVAGDASAAREPGTWILRTGGLERAFRVDDTILRTPSRLAMRAFYLWRSGVELPVRHAGKWSRKAGHPDTSLGYYEARAERGAKFDVHGGWYDAGDFGKYVVTGAAAVANLMLLHRIIPDAFPDGSLGIPESGNGGSDLLDEIRWELEWLMRMQDADGGVFFKVAGRRWPGAVKPVDDTIERRVIGKATASTLDFAAVTAMASRVWKDTDSLFSRRCLDASRKAWSWAVRFPKVPQPSDGTGSGLYQDHRYEDEFFWAEVELWLATGDSALLGGIERRMRVLPAIHQAGWQDVRNFAWYAMALTKESNPLRDRALKELDARAGELIAMARQSGMMVPMEGFRAGSNGTVASRGVLMAIHHHLRRESTSLKGAQDCVDYLLGRNPVGTSYVTGVGDVSPNDPHFRLALSYGSDKTMPGFLVGGPNVVRREDRVRRPGGVVYPRTEPARAWADDRRSSSTNEVAINWNASLVFLLSYCDRRSAKGSL